MKTQGGLGAVWVVVWDDFGHRIANVQVRRGWSGWSGWSGTNLSYAIIFGLEEEWVLLGGNRSAMGGLRDHPDHPSQSAQGKSEVFEVVRGGQRRRRASQSDFDNVPCAMRLTIVGKDRLQNPVPGRPNGVSRNHDVLVWCDCMAQTSEQLGLSREVASSRNASSVKWPSPKHQREWDVLGAVRSTTDERIGRRGFKSNPNSGREARKMWDEHVEARRQRIEGRRGAPTAN